MRREREREETGKGKGGEEEGEEERVRGGSVMEEEGACEKEGDISGGNKWGARGGCDG